MFLETFIFLEKNWQRLEEDDPIALIQTYLLNSYFRKLFSGME